ncbi:MAG: sigma-54-dependent Fis family transcriptional regulator [Deltaproteobacteria bacterium]|nr:sigma-54-dependent Fis family transcriptional regulator [Deltaproteobacteria bacterium]
MSHRVLVAEDDATTRYLIEEYCRAEPFELTFAADGVEAMRLLKEVVFDIVVTDVRLPGVSGDAVLTFVRETRPEVPVIVITGFGSIDGAVRFLQGGAFDYIAKPFTGQVFTHRLSLASRHLDLRIEVNRLRSLGPGLGRIISADPGMVRLQSRLPSIAKTEASVVLYGESGTGKELFARAVHELSRRAEQRFVSVSCAALPETLIESELFGHTRGAFTDAHLDRTGLIEEAEGGTLFLDEVGELPITVQAKLLRFLQEREFKPVGSNEIKHANVRIVAATNRNLEQEVAMARFREDLFYRLNVVPIRLPPLRERPGDIPLLANHYLGRFAKEFEREVPTLSAEVLALMAAYSWPGNVRELMNRVQRMVVMCDERVVRPEVWYRSGFDAVAQSGEDGILAERGFAAEKVRVVARFESRFLTECLRHAAGNVAAAARIAKIDRKNFWTLMKRHRIDPALFKGQTS